MDRKQRDQISAFLDGEARAPGAVERLLRDDPRAAAYHRELAALSRSIRTLEAPDVHPAFAARVMAEVSETRMARRAPRWLLAGAPALVLAVALFAVVYLALPWSAPAPAPDPRPVGGGQFLAAVDVESISQLIEERIASGENVALDDIGLLGPIEEDETTLGVELLYELEYGVGAFADSGNTLDGIDVETVLADLNHDVEDELRELLVSYAQGAAS